MEESEWPVGEHAMAATLAAVAELDAVVDVPMLLATEEIAAAAVVPNSGCIPLVAADMLAKCDMFMAAAANKASLSRLSLAARLRTY